MILPALTLWQPWASLVAMSVKPYETRSFRPPAHLLGRRIAIHAAARKPDVSDVSDRIHDAMQAATGDPRWFGALPRGAVLCTAFLAEALPTEEVPPDPFGDYTPGRFAWRLTELRRLDPPIAAKGRQRIGWDWSVPEGVAFSAFGSSS